MSPKYVGEYKERDDKACHVCRVLKPKEVRVLMRYDPLKPEEEFPVYKYLSTTKTTSVNTSLT